MPGRMRKRLFIGKLPHRANEDDIRDLLERFGHVNDVSLKPGFAFVDMESERDAEDAVEELDGTRFMGERLNIEFAKGTPHGRDLQKDRDVGIEYPEERHDRDRYYDRRPPRGGGRYGGRPPPRPAPRRRPSTTYPVEIENVSTRITTSYLKDYCRKYGAVWDVRLKEDRIAEVEFEDERDAEYCVKKMDGVELKEREVKVSMLSPRKERSRSRSRSRSRGRKRSRSQSRSPPPRRDRSGSGDRKSKSKSRSRSGSNEKRDRSRSASQNGDASPKKSPTPKKSRSKSPHSAAASGSENNDE